MEGNEKKKKKKKKTLKPLICYVRHKKEIPIKSLCASLAKQLLKRKRGCAR